MNKLILHIGPGKCGSSSIQEFFIKHKNPCEEKLNFILMDPTEISKESEEYFTQLIKNSLKKKAITILSHEFLFQKPFALKKICCTAKKNTSIDEIQIIGYCRKQSDFIVSAYSQWWFRAPNRIQEINDTLREIGIDPKHFNGIERQLIGSIYNDFYSARQLSNDSILDWNKQYKLIESLTHSLGVRINCGLLPNKQSKVNLIEDFCSKAGLTIRSEAQRFTRIKSNKKFDNNLVEAVNIATELGLDAPTPHQDNSFFTENILNSKYDNFQNNHLIETLKQYIDYYYLESNSELCDKYDLEKSYFRTSKTPTKNEILEIIKTEQSTRKDSGEMIVRYKTLIGIIAGSLYHNYKLDKRKSDKSSS